MSLMVKAYFLRTKECEAVARDLGSTFPGGAVLETTGPWTAVLPGPGAEGTEPLYMPAPYVSVVINEDYGWQAIALQPEVGRCVVTAEWYRGGQPWQVEGDPRAFERLGISVDSLREIGRKRSGGIGELLSLFHVGEWIFADLEDVAEQVESGRIGGILIPSGQAAEPPRFAEHLGKHARLAIPSALFGDKRVLKRKWRAICRRVQAGAPWADVLAKDGWRSLGGASVLLLEEQTGPCDEAAAHLYLPFHTVVMTCDWSDRRKLVSGAMEQFWGVLCYLGEHGGLDLDLQWPQRQEWSRQMLTKVMRWWDVLCDIDPAFVGEGGRPRPWPSWAQAIMGDYAIAAGENLYNTRIGATDFRDRVVAHLTEYGSSGR